MSKTALKSIIQDRTKVLIVFDDMIFDMISDRKHHFVVPELFMGR